MQMQEAQSELPRPIKIRPGMYLYVRRSIMYEKVAFCSPEQYSSVDVPLKFDKLCFLQEFNHKMRK